MVLGLRTLAIKAMEAHKQAYEEWPHGEIKDFRMESGCDVVVQYEDGTWYHYKNVDVPNKEITWW